MKWTRQRPSEIKYLVLREFDNSEGHSYHRTVAYYTPDQPDRPLPSLHECQKTDSWFLVIDKPGKDPNLDTLVSKSDMHDRIERVLKIYNRIMAVNPGIQAHVALDLAKQELDMITKAVT